MRSHRIGGRGKRRHPIRIVSTWDAALRLVDGKTVKDSEGIEGVLKVVRLGPHDTRLMHVKTEKGKRTAAYQATRAKLHDDWDTDLTNSDSSQAIMEELGVRFTYHDKVQRRSGSVRSMRGASGRT
jgi:hypothetical protein